MNWNENELIKTLPQTGVRQVPASVRLTEDFLKSNLVRKSHSTFWKSQHWPSTWLTASMIGCPELYKQARSTRQPIQTAQDPLKSR